MPKYSVVMVETFGVEVEAKTEADAQKLGRKTINANPSKHHMDEYIKVKRARSPIVTAEEAKEGKNVQSRPGLIGIDKPAQ